MNKTTFMCQKLVRDKTPECMRTRNIAARYRILDSAEYPHELHKKLMEEALELTQAQKREDIAAEIADVLEVIKAYKKAYNISPAEITAAQQKAREERGGFEQRVFLESIEMSTEHPEIPYFRGLPHKYPEK